MRADSERDQDVRRKLQSFFRSRSSRDGQRLSEAYERYHSRPPSGEGDTSQGRVKAAQAREGRPTTGKPSAATALAEARQNERNYTAAQQVHPDAPLGAAGRPQSGGGLASVLRIPGILGRTIPAAVAGNLPPAGGDGELHSLMEQELAALGGGPDKASYLRPFEEAEARARKGHGEALPVIASAYDQLRNQLSSSQQGFAGEQARVASEQQARAAQLSDNVRRLQAPGMADLQTQSGGSAVPSLTAGVAAHASQNEANLADAQRRQASFLENLGRTSEQSHQSRLSDSQVAQEAAAQNASLNLNTILSQLGVQKANAERQYSGDVRAHQERQGDAIRSYAEQRRQDAVKAEQEQAAVAKEEEKRADQLDKLTRHVAKTGAPFGSFVKTNEQIRSRYPKHFEAALDLIREDYEPGDLGRASAHVLIDQHRRDFEGDYALEQYGARLNLQRLHEIADLWYDQEEGHMMPFLAAGMRR